MDLSVQDAALTVFDYTKQQGLSVDVLINNAGFGDAGSVAAAGIRAMEKGKALCYQGFFTKTMSIGARIMPRAVTRYFAHKMNQ